MLFLHHFFKKYNLRNLNKVQISSIGTISCN